MPFALLFCLLLAACQASAGVVPAAGPTPAAIPFTSAAVGPVALAGGAVVVDPGLLCPPTSLHVVGAGLPPGQVTIALQAAGEPVAVRPDGSFEHRLAWPPAGGSERLEVVITHGDARAIVPIAVCSPAPWVPGLVVAAAAMVQ